jgi:anaerobic dimethyl sulfoxide reductase subunit B (iron-sulfur subunit)
MTYAFTFDASACSGCKACQIACKDKNNLPSGVLWRRVYEVSGGSWTNVGADGVRPGVWETDVFAYNLSIACNHCVHPKCAGVCPTDAYIVRPDGIVYIDESKCVGCGYCSWACPYSAPRYNPELHHMTKCNFCFDNIDAGLPPACVAACPMRVLDYVTVDDGPTTVENGQRSTVHGQELQPLWNTPGSEHPFPLPTFSRTQPHILLKPHMAMSNDLKKTITNWEEIQTQRARSTPRKTFESLVPFVFKGFDELPLIAFTLLAQMAVGIALFSFFSGPLNIPILVTLGGLIGFGALTSLLHLGTPLNAWRTLNHLKKSSLSREILMFGLFGASWLVCLVLPGMGKLPLALSGIGLVYNMAQVYRFKAAPAWNTWQTPVSFFLSAGVLGALAVHFAAPGIWLAIGAGVLLAAEVGVMLSEKNPRHEMARKARMSLILVGMAGVAAMVFLTGNIPRWLSACIFLIVLVEEIIGRWLFYEARVPVL